MPLFQGYDDLFSAIEANILSQHSILFAEPYFLLQNELREIGSYFSIIKAICRRGTESSSYVHPQRCCHSCIQKYMETLIQLELAKHVPITENPGKSQKHFTTLKTTF